MIVMATTSNPNSVATKLTSHFLHEVHMSTPSQGDCERMLSGLCNKTSVAKGSVCVWGGACVCVWGVHV